MRKIIFVLLLFTSCGSNSSDGKKVSKEPKFYYHEVARCPSVQVYMVRIDECEYLIADGSYGRDIIHKENCDNPFHLPCGTVTLSGESKASFTLK